MKKETGLTLKEAIESKRPFKRISDNSAEYFLGVRDDDDVGGALWLISKDGDLRYCLSTSDIIANDYKLEPFTYKTKKVLYTRYTYMWQAELEEIFRTNYTTKPFPFAGRENCILLEVDTREFEVPCE